MIDKIMTWGLIGLMVVMFGALSLIPISVIYRLVAPSPIMQLSDGTMRATSAKLSYKGIFWKTTEGWISIGVNSEGGLKKWHFTVKDNDENIIACINDNEKVKLHYKDYIWMPFRQGSSHQVNSCEVIR